MFILLNIGKKHMAFAAVLTAVCIIAVSLLGNSSTAMFSVFKNNDKEIAESLEYMLTKRNKAILDSNYDTLKSFYNRNSKLGIWAYEHQVKKVKYLHNWAEKQGIKFKQIDSHIVVRRATQKNEGYRINFSTFTKYSYFYQNEPSTVNSFKIGTYHSMDVIGTDEEWVIQREWYTDPFADSLNLNQIKTDEITNYILSETSRDFSDMNERRKGAVEYADKYCGTSTNQTDEFQYNKEYKNYNYSGGDCANFASQVLHEGGQFKKNYTWGYAKDGSKAWVNANAFKNYLLYSGRASLVARGSYEKVLKASYKLLPGDIVAYEKKGKVVHVSVVTGADSKGYTLINCHNTDRYKVPWDLGWSDKGINFWLIHVHY